MRPGESYRDAAARRCEEELGLTAALELVGKTEMSDLGGVKHVSLFVARVGRSRPAIREPDHIARLSWTTLGEIARLITTDPDRFTETFLWLFEHFYADGQTRTAVGA